VYGVALQIFLLSETIKIIPSGIDKGAHNGTIGRAGDCQKCGRSLLTFEKRQSWWPAWQK
jgi:hypothetical protein